MVFYVVAAQIKGRDEADIKRAAEDALRNGGRPLGNVHLVNVSFHVWIRKNWPSLIGRQV